MSRRGLRIESKTNALYLMEDTPHEWTLMRGTISSANYGGDSGPGTWSRTRCFGGVLLQLRSPELGWTVLRGHVGRCLNTPIVEEGWSWASWSSSGRVCGLVHSGIVCFKHQSLVSFRSWPYYYLLLFAIIHGSCQF